MRHVVFPMVCTILLSVATAACPNAGVSDQSALRVVPGSLYTVNDGEGWFRIAKVLVVDDEAVHIRVYRNRFKERPTTVDQTALTLGSIHDPGGFGMGHLPLTRAAFAEMEPVFLLSGTVDAEELEGYTYWKEAGGGLFGD